MLFTSAIFAFFYLPVVFAGFFALGRYAERGAAAWLFLASTAFYGYWMPEFTLLLLSSIGWNFWVGMRIAKNLQPANQYIIIEKRREEKRREEKRREEKRREEKRREEKNCATLAYCRNYCKSSTAGLF